MAPPFTRENAREMAKRSALARKQKREMAAQVEQGIEQELGKGPVSRALIGYLRENPKAMHGVIAALFEQAQRGNVKAATTLMDRLEPPGSEAEQGPASEAVARITALLPKGTAIAIGSAGPPAAAEEPEPPTLDVTPEPAEPPAPVEADQPVKAVCPPGCRCERCICPKCGKRRDPRDNAGRHSQYKRCDCRGETCECSRCQAGREFEELMREFRANRRG